MLEKTEYLPSLEGKRWNGNEDDGETLTSEQQRLIKRAAIDITIVKRESDEDTKFDLFQRLNTGGSQLSDQEVRNCLLIMVEREFYTWLRELQSLEAFQRTIAISDRAQDEQYDLELVIRFLSIKDASDEELRAIRDMNDFLTKTSIRDAASRHYDRDRQRREFTETFELIDDALSDHAFRRYNQQAERFMGGSRSQRSKRCLLEYTQIAKLGSLLTAMTATLVSQKLRKAFGKTRFFATARGGELGRPVGFPTSSPEDVSSSCREGPYG